MHRLILFAALFPAIAIAQPDMDALLESSRQLALYGEAASRCNASIQALGRYALTNNDDCVRLRKDLDAADGFAKSAAAHMKSIDYDTLSESEKHIYSATLHKNRAAIEEIMDFVRRAHFLER